MGWAVYLIPGNVQIVQDPTVPSYRVKIVCECLDSSYGVVFYDRSLVRLALVGRVAVRNRAEVRGLAWEDLTVTERQFYRFEWLCELGRTMIGVSSSRRPVDVYPVPCRWRVQTGDGICAPTAEPVEGPCDRLSMYQWACDVYGQYVGGTLPPSVAQESSRVVARLRLIAYPFEPDRPQE